MLEPSGTNTHLKLTIAAISMAAILAGLTATWALGPVQSGAQEEQAFTVQPGWGSMRIADELGRVALIRSPVLFTVYVRISGIGSDLQAGTYLLSRGMTPVAIAKLIAAGEAIPTDIEVTVPEGMNLWDIDAYLVDRLHSLPGQFSSAFVQDEGRLFPDTYRIPKDGTFRDLGGKMSAAFSQQVHVTPAQLIVASILEKEAKTAEDMALVSGIIAKRQQLGMPLQVDATVGYGWCVRSSGHGRPCDVTQAPIVTEIKVDGPYNTYTRKGLPRGPISNPGLQALQAAANPKASQNLYYLSTRDGSKIIYARTLEEHLENRRNYLDI